MTDIHPACALCKGSCCETFTVPVPPDADPDVARWMGLRGPIRNRVLRIEARCSALTDEGGCAIYSTRPQPCRNFPVGSDACKSAIVARRPEQANDILRLAMRDGR